MSSVSGLTRVRKLLGRIRRSFSWDTFDVFVRPVTADDRTFEELEGYRFSWATPDEIAGCDEFHTELDQRERDEGIVRLGLGHRCVIAFHGETAVFTMWVNPRNLNVPGHVKRRLSEDQVFIYKAYTSPDHRGKRLYGAGMRFVLADLSARGMNELVGYAHLKKKISRKGLARLQFESRGQFTRIACPGWSHTFVSGKLAAHFPVRRPRTDAVTMKLAS